MKKTAAIYARLSKEDLDKGEGVSESIRNQKSMLVSYAVQHEWEVCDIYCDEDYSGAYAGDENIRPEFNRMIEDASKHKFDIVLCKSQSRFSRNMEVIEQYIHGKFALWGIRFIGVTDYVDTDIKGNKKSRQINSLINEWYLDDLSENIRAVYKHKMELGEFLAAFAPYGYSKDSEKKNHLIINPNTAPVIKQIFMWHTEGYGAVKISRMLNERKVPCPRKQQEIDGMRKTCVYAQNDLGKWSAASVSDILHNQVYCGDVVQHTVEKVSYKSRKRHRLKSDEWIVIQDMHEPIVSREMFEATQKRLASKRKSTGTGKVHILSGKVFCHCCGKPMQKNNSKGHYEYLRCRDKYTCAGRERCSTPNIRIDTIFNALSMELIEKFRDMAVENIDDDIIMNLSAQKSGKDNTELERLKKEKKQLERRRRNLYDDRLNEIITVEEYLNWNKELSEKNDLLTKQIGEFERALSAGNDDTEQLKAIRKELKEYLQKKNIDREIIENLIYRIEFGERDENGNVILSIFWK